MTEDEFDLLLVDAREQLAADIDDERASALPDFASMIAAAHEFDPEQVPLEWVHEAEALAPVLDLRARESAAGMLAENQLDGLIAEARSAAEVDVADRRLAAIPAFTAPSVALRKRRWVPLLAAAAAIVGLALALPRLLDRFVDAARSEGATNNQAEFRSQERGNDATDPHPKMERVGPSNTTGEAIAVPDAHKLEAATGPAPEPATAAKPGASKRSLDERIAALDDEAQRQWAAGELEAAQATFRTIIELAGHGRHADLAYGDLFTLTHQRKDEVGELGLWREYLRRFPKGRFADDARAGVCRRSDADERDACWQTYLDDFPSGVHRRSATRALDGSESP